MKIEKLKTLSDKINALGHHAARYDLQYLIYLLEKNTKINADSPIVQKLDVLVDAINTIDDDPSKARVDVLIKSYHELCHVAHTDHWATKIYTAVLNFIGVMISIVAAVVLAIPFSLLVGIEKSAEYKKFIPAAFVFGLLLGVIIGLMFGWRFPKRIGMTRSFRDLQDTVHRIGATLDYEKLTLLDKREDSYMACYEKEASLLKALFKDSQGAFDNDAYHAFLDSTQDYQLSSLSAKFFTRYAKGYLGHHSMITFKINDKHYVIELGAPTPPETVTFPQTEKGGETRFEREHRQTTGHQLLKMLAMNAHLQPRFEFSKANAKRFFMEYKIGERDCHRYVSLVLSSVGEEANTLEKSPEKGRKGLGRDLTRLANFLSPSDPKVLLNKPKFG